MTSRHYMSMLFWDSQLRGQIWGVTYWRLDSTCA